MVQQLTGPTGKTHEYVYSFPGVPVPVRILGSYVEGLQSGGCDALKEPLEVYARIEELHAVGVHVLFEGIRMMNPTRGLEMFRRTKDVTVVLLDTPLEKSLSGIYQRRQAQGNNEPLKTTSHVEGNVVRARNYADKLRAIGARKIYCDRDDAPQKILQLLRSAQ